MCFYGSFHFRLLRILGTRSSICATINGSPFLSKSVTSPSTLGSLMSCHICLCVFMLFLPLFFLVCSSMAICILGIVLVLVFLVSICGYISYIYMLVGLLCPFLFFSSVLPLL